MLYSLKTVKYATHKQDNVYTANSQIQILAGLDYAISQKRTLLLQGMLL